MPHVSIKHFPVEITEEQSARLVAAVTATVSENLGCDEGVISIALEAVDPADWQEQVYEPEITARRHLLRKLPNY